MKTTGFQEITAVTWCDGGALYETAHHKLFVTTQDSRRFSMEEIKALGGRRGDLDFLVLTKERGLGWYRL